MQASFIQAARKLLPSYTAAHISFYLPYAKHFFDIPGLGFNIHFGAIAGIFGSSFLRKARDAGRLVFTWTINEERWMEWCIQKNADGQQKGTSSSSSSGWESKFGEVGGAKKLVDGVITDDPKLYLEVCERWEDEQDGKTLRKKLGLYKGLKQRVGGIFQLIMFHVLTTGFYFTRRYQGKFDLLKDVKKA